MCHIACLIIEWEIHVKGRVGLLEEREGEARRRERIAVGGLVTKRSVVLLFELYSHVTGGLLYCGFFEIMRHALYCIAPLFMV